jgi:hypothetical protein
LKAISIPASVAVISGSCFSECKSLTSISFSVDSKLSRLEKYAFSLSGLETIIIPASVEVICDFCFCQCKSLTSISFAAGSRFL